MSIGLTACEKSQQQIEKEAKQRDAKIELEIKQRLAEAEKKEANEQKQKLAEAEKKIRVDTAKAVNPQIDYEKIVDYEKTDIIKNQAYEFLIDSVKISLKDPDSAKFMDVVHYVDSYVKDNVRYPVGYVICGKINAKNSYGGYSGYLEFFASTYVEGRVLKKPTIEFDSKDTHETFMESKSLFCKDSEHFEKPN